MRASQIGTLDLLMTQIDTGEQDGMQDMPPCTLLTLPHPESPDSIVWFKVNSDLKILFVPPTSHSGRVARPSCGGYCKTAVSYSQEVVEVASGR